MNLSFSKSRCTVCNLRVKCKMELKNDTEKGNKQIRNNKSRQQHDDINGITKTQLDTQNGLIVVKEKIISLILYN